MLYEHACGSQRGTRGVQHADGVQEASNYEPRSQDQKRHSGGGSNLHQAKDDYSQGCILDEISVSANPAAERFVIGIAMRHVQLGALEGYLDAKENHHYGKNGGNDCCDCREGHFFLSWSPDYQVWGAVF